MASHGYFAGREMPEHPQDLLRHNCVNMRHITAGDLYAWAFEKDGQPLRVRVDGQLTINNSYGMIDAAVAGLGVAYVPVVVGAAQLRAGILVWTLDEWSPSFEGPHLYHPQWRQKLQVFRTDAVRYKEQRGT